MTLVIVCIVRCLVCYVYFIRVLIIPRGRKETVCIDYICGYAVGYSVVVVSATCLRLSVSTIVSVMNVVRMNTYLY